MPPNSEFIYVQLGRFLALASRVMGDQAGHLMNGVRLLSLELADKITPDQEKRFRDIMTIARFLRTEVIDHWVVYDIVLDLLFQPTQVIWDEVNMYSEIQRAIEHTKWFRGDLSELVTVETTDKEVFARSTGPLLTQAISCLLIWVHLLAPSSPILIGLTKTETEITLKLSGRGLSSQIDFIEEEACSILRGLAELIVSVLGGSFSWKTGQIIPDEDELMIHLPPAQNEVTIT